MMLYNLCNIFVLVITLCYSLKDIQNVNITKIVTSQHMSCQSFMSDYTGLLIAYNVIHFSIFRINLTPANV